MRQLEYLVASVDRGSIAQAAIDLNVSQPTISVAIAKLEDQFGIQLLTRQHSQGVSPTPSAEQLLQSARSLLSQARDLQNLALSARSDVSGDLYLGSFSALAPTVLPSLISSLLGQYPDIKLHLSEGSQQDVISDLRDGNIEMAILYDIDLPDYLRKIPLSLRMPYAALSTTHPLADAPDVSLEELVNDPLILLDVVPSRAYFLGLFSKAGLTPNVAHSSPSLELVRGMVGHGLGYSLLVTRPIGDTTHDGRKLVIKPLRGDIEPSRLVLCHHTNLRPSRIMQSVENVARQSLA